MVVFFTGVFVFVFGTLVTLYLLQLGFPNYVELIDPTSRDAEGVD